MSLNTDQTLIAEFTQILASPPPAGRQKEQVIQDFLENHPELIPTPNRLNHQLHFKAIISKFPLATELTTDYVYMTKSSDTWRVTFVELEVPDKDIFVANPAKVVTTADFNAALNQVRSWKIFIDDNRTEVLRKLDPLFQPHGMKANPIEFNYQLIIGRSAGKNISPARKKHLRLLIKESGIDIMTYDSLLTWFKEDRKFKKNILRLAGDTFEFKIMHEEPEHMFAYIGPDKLQLTAAQKDRLQTAGYEIDKWVNGDFLVFDSKFTTSTGKKILKIDF